MEDTEMTDSLGRKMSIQGVDNFFTNVEAAVPKNTKDRSEIIEPGAFYAQDHLWPKAPYMDHVYPSQFKLGSKLRNPQHLHDKDAVTHKPAQYMDGSTEVGFIPQAAPIARWVDQGTYRQNPQFFIEHAFESMDYDELFALQAEVFSEQIQRKVSKNSNN